MAHGDGGPDQGRKIKALLGPREVGWVVASPDGTAEIDSIPFDYPYVNMGDVVPLATVKAERYPIAVPIPIHRTNHAWASVRARTKSLRKWKILMDRLHLVFKTMGVEIECAKVGWLVMAAPQMEPIMAAIKLFGFFRYWSVQLPPAVRIPADYHPLK